jgi:flagellar basal-body rod modification protein FlgD
MSIEGILTGYGGSSIPAEKTSSDKNSEGLGMNQFLTLLVAQLEHQDPLSPLDSSEFTAQLAQFSMVEQQYRMNKNLADIKDILSSRGEQQDLLGYIGKTVKADDDKIFVKDDKVLSGSFSLEDKGDVAVNVYDSDGLMVRTLYLGVLGNGEHSVNWDGKDNQGKFVKNGTYNFEVKAIDEDGRYVAANTHITGEVTGVTYEHGYPYLMIGDRLISDDNVVEVSKTTQ